MPEDEDEDHLRGEGGNELDWDDGAERRSGKLYGRRLLRRSEREGGEEGGG